MAEKEIHLNKLRDLKYGENPHQQASLYGHNREIDWELLFGDELTYNNIVDSTCALEVAIEFYDVFGVIFVKHSNPTAVALSSSLEFALSKALDSDPFCSFNSTAAFTKEIDIKLAQNIMNLNLNTIIAPSYSDEALYILKKDKNLKIIKIITPLKDIIKYTEEEIKMTPFGAIIQEKDIKDLDVKTFKVTTKKKPEQSEVEDMIFAQKIVKHVKSDGIVIAKDLRTVGICAGQTNRTTAIEFALNKICDSPKDSVAASDGAISSILDIQILAQNRISGIIQPAGNAKDNEIIQEADKLNISMISTGIRHLKH